MATVAESFTIPAEITGARYFKPSRPEERWRIYGTGTTIPLTVAARQRSIHKRLERTSRCSAPNRTAPLRAA